ncbi:MAG TPA: chlorite dismutase family protein, partial [Acidimicrobiales bacterium]|nr:chlorite dismutase family protein [Acidimicrobiales bacterium]
MSAPLVPATGWVVLHLFMRVGAGTDGEAVVTAVKDAAGTPDTQVVAFTVLGHKADFGVMALAPDLWNLRRLQTALAAAGADVASSYVSLTEVSEYAQGMPEERKRPRLYPALPPEGKRAFCFYPMSKRRWVGANWYQERYEERDRLMREHGATGRTFAGRVVQLVTGSMGLDDFEWGVTLFAERPDDLKEVVSKMRYDEVSARFAEFGPF